MSNSDATEADETYLEVDMEAEAGTGPATAIILESVAEVLRDAPEGYRCDFGLVIEESGGGSYDIEKDPDQSFEAYQSTKRRWLENIDVRMYGVDADRIREDKHGC